jgi:hypothetical protein
VAYQEQEFTMDKINRIAAAALLASTMAYATPALSVDTSAEQFVIGLSGDFSQGNLTNVLAKLDELKRLGFEGVMFDDDQMVSVNALIDLLGDVQQGEVAGERVAATLLAYLNEADEVRFVMGGIFTNVADLNAGVEGSTFPAGYAG